MPSFDIVSEIDKSELKNAIDQVNKEITTRFDFKGSSCKVEATDPPEELTIWTDHDLQLNQVKDILRQKMAKRGISTNVLMSDDAKLEKVSGNKLKEITKLVNSLSSDHRSKIIKLIKDTKLKVQSTQQGDSIRVSATKRDDLQKVIEMLNATADLPPLQFNNFRD